jgi:hypothetical protein
VKDGSMPRKFRRRSVSAREEFYIYEDISALNCRRTRRISYDRGETLALNGHAIRCYTPAGVHVGYELVQQVTYVKNGAIGSRPRPSMLTARDMELIAGLYGESKTENMPESQRVTRVHPVTRRILPPEDDIERAKAKLEEFTPQHLRDARKMLVQSYRREPGPRSLAG